MTMTAEEFSSQFVDEYGDVNDPSIPLVYVGDEQIEMKMVYTSNVYQCGEQFFEVMLARSNSGYWGDAEYEDPQVSEVFPYTFTETRYK